MVVVVRRRAVAEVRSRRRRRAVGRGVAVRGCGGRVVGWDGPGRVAVCRARVACRMTTTRSVSKRGKEGGVVVVGFLQCEGVRTGTGRSRRGGAASYKRSSWREHGLSLDERLLNIAEYLAYLHMSPSLCNSTKVHFVLEIYHISC